jgi:hypothetical protein
MHCTFYRCDLKQDVTAVGIPIERLLKGSHLPLDSTSPGTIWAWVLLRDAARVLLVAEVREVIEQGEVPARITDLHVWRVGRGKFACVVSLVTTARVDADYFRIALSVHEELVHVTVEVERIGGVAV